MDSGFPTWGSGYRGRGASVAATSPTTGAVAVTRAHQRQRDDGSDPVGVSNSTKPPRER
jgi:hypothetical protein